MRRRTSVGSSIGVTIENQTVGNSCLMEICQLPIKHEHIAAESGNKTNQFQVGFYFRQQDEHY